MPRRKAIERERVWSYNRALSDVDVFVGIHDSDVISRITTLFQILHLGTIIGARDARTLQFLHRTKKIPSSMRI